MMDVYQKIREAKMAENIMIDAAFKASLREKILAQASALSAQQTESSFFQKWRYSFALVPAFLLMVIVALQATRLPVTIPSETVNPDTATSLQATSQISDRSGSSETTIQTFAGSSVMPKNYGNKNESPDSENQNIVQKEPEKVQTPTHESTSNPPQAPVSPNVEVPYQNQVPQPPVLYQLPSVQNVNPVPENQPGYHDARAPQANSINKVNPQDLQASQEENVMASGSNQETSSVPQTQQALQLKDGNKAASLMAPSSAFSFSVSYQGTFSNDEKTLINQTIVPQLITDKNPVSVSVSEDRSHSILTIKLAFEDGTSETHYYKKDFETQQWIKMPAS